MEKKIIYIVLLVLTLFTSCISTKSLKIGGDWSGYEYSYFCPAFKFSETGKASQELDVLNANSIDVVREEVDKVQEVIKNYIIEQSGTNFYEKLIFDDIDITFLDSLECFKNKRPLYDLEKCGNTKYFVRYLFVENLDTL
jgi:hypothetical protein